MSALRVAAQDEIRIEPGVKLREIYRLSGTERERAKVEVELAGARLQWLSA